MGRARTSLKASTHLAMVKRGRTRGGKISSGVVWDRARAVESVFGAPRGPGEAGRTPNPAHEVPEGSADRLSARGIRSSADGGSDYRLPLRAPLPCARAYGNYEGLLWRARRGIRGAWTLRSPGWVRAGIAARRRHTTSVITGCGPCFCCLNVSLNGRLWVAGGLTLDLASHLGCQGVHRQLHGTGQGTAEGPLNWLPVADIVIAVARAASTNPVTMPTGGGAPVEVPVAVYVDDSALAQAGPKAVPSLRKMVNMTGFMYDFLGLGRRAKKCL